MLRSNNNKKNAIINLKPFASCLRIERTGFKDYAKFCLTEGVAKVDKMASVDVV